MGKRTNEEYIELLKIANDKVIPLEDYNGSNKKILHKCLACNNEWMVVPHSLLRGYGCPKCFRKRKIKVHDCFAKEVYDLVGDEYTLLTKYNKAHEKIKVKHNVCGTEYEVMSYKILDGKRCPTCFGNAKKTTDEFKSEIHNLVGYEYSILEDYINDSTKIFFKHNKCGTSYKVRPNDFLNGKRCPTCMQSKGEKRIKEHLDFLNIKYIPQMKYDDLLGVNNGQLSYDFYIPIKNILIEYQGQYHDGTTGNQTEEQFANQQEHDKRKEQYANNNNIKLLEIWYWDYDNVEEILNNNLSTK